MSNLLNVDLRILGLSFKPSNDFPYHYFIFKVCIYAVTMLLIYSGTELNSLYQGLLSVSSFVDLTVILTCILAVNKSKFSYKGLFYGLSLASIFLIALAPIPFDDLSYGLTLPQKIFEKKSFFPIGGYGVFSYFPSIDFSRTVLTFAFGGKSQLFFFRIEAIAFFLTSIFLLNKIFKLSTKNIVLDEGSSLFGVLLIFTSFSAVSVFAFAKPESFILLAFLLAIYYSLIYDFQRAFICAFAGLPFKYTSVFSLAPVLFFSLTSLWQSNRQIFKGNLLIVLLVIVILIPWLNNNYQNTGSLLYPFLTNYFSYTSDGVMDNIEYKKVISFLFSQQDVSLTGIISYKYFYYIGTQLAFVLPLMVFALLNLYSTSFRFRFSSVYRGIFLLSLLAFSIFMMSLFSEFRYIYGLICIFALPSVVLIIGNTGSKYQNLLKLLFSLMIVLQIVFVTIRFVRNSSFDLKLISFPVNLSTSDIAVVNCVNSLNSSDPDSSIASFDQAFYLWNKPFFFLHELNEYIGLSPSTANIIYAIKKIIIKYLYSLLINYLRKIQRDILLTLDTHLIF